MWLNGHDTNQCPLLEGNTFLPLLGCTRYTATRIASLIFWIAIATAGIKIVFFEFLWIRECFRTTIADICVTIKSRYIHERTCTDILVFCFYGRGKGYSKKNGNLSNLHGVSVCRNPFHTLIVEMQVTETSYLWKFYAKHLYIIPLYKMLYGCALHARCMHRVKHVYFVCIYINVKVNQDALTRGNSLP